MKLLAFGDIHAQTRFIPYLKTLVQQHQPDLIVCCGDISIFHQGLESTLKKLAALNKPLIIIPGNHEAPNHLKNACKPFANIIYLHHHITTINDITFIGSGTGGFAHIDPGFERFVKKNHQKILNKKIVLITHGPPARTKLDKLGKHHVGCVSYRRFILQYPSTILALSGHLHENFGKHDKLGTTLLLNPGPLGRVIEL